MTVENNQDCWRSRPMMPVKKLAIIVGRFMLQQKGVCSQWGELLIVQADKRELNFPTTKLATYVHRQSSVQKTHTLLSNVAQKNLGPSLNCASFVNTHLSSLGSILDHISRRVSLCLSVAANAFHPSGRDSILNFVSPNPWPELKKDIHLLMQGSTWFHPSGLWFHCKDCVSKMLPLTCYKLSCSTVTQMLLIKINKLQQSKNPIIVS